MSNVVSYSSSADDAPLSMRFERPNQCTLCDALIRSEVNLFSHLKGIRHRDALRAKYGNEKADDERAREMLNLEHIREVAASPIGCCEFSKAVFILRFGTVVVR